MNIEVGEHYEGKDCHGDLIAGTITKILEKTFIVSSGTETFLVKQEETKDKKKVIN